MKNSFLLLIVIILSVIALNIEDSGVKASATKQSDEINALVEDIKEQFKVNIYVKDKVQNNFPDFLVEVNTDENDIKRTLNDIKIILNKFGSEFGSNFYKNNYKGLNIFLAGHLTPKDIEVQASNPLAYSLVYNKEYMIVLDASYEDIQTVICHELMHNISNNLENLGVDFLNDWESLNPKDFYYTNGYNVNSGFDYTLRETEAENVYFIDKYAHTFQEEDEARIFEAVCSASYDNMVKNYPNLYAKALYLQAEILKNYPFLSEETLFDSLN